MKYTNTQSESFQAGSGGKNVAACGSRNKERVKKCPTEPSRES